MDFFDKSTDQVTNNDAHKTKAFDEVFNKMTNQITNNNTNTNSHYEKHKMQKSKSLKVAFLLIHPFVFKNVDGVVSEDGTVHKYSGYMYDLWLLVKPELQKRGITDIEEFYLDNITHQQLYEDIVNGKYDLAIGNFSITSERTGGSYTRPIFLNKFAIAYEYSPYSQITTFFEILLYNFIPPLFVLFTISIILGILLDKFSPRPARHTAIWQTISSLLGEAGYLSEHLSDNYKNVTNPAYSIVLIILLSAFYFGIYLQSTVTVALATAGKSGEEKVTPEQLQGVTILVPKGYANKSHWLQDGVNMVIAKDNKNMVQEYLNNTKKFFGYFKDWEELKDDIKKFPNLRMSNSNLGYEEIAWVANNDEDVLLEHMDVIITDLKEDRQVVNICARYFGKDKYLCEI